MENYGEDLQGASSVGVLVRSLHEADAREFLGLVTDNKDSLLPWLTTPLRVTDLISARREVQLTTSGGRPARYGLFVHSQLVGSLKVMEVDVEVPDLELGFWVAESHRGQGLGQVLLLAGINAAFTLHGANRVTLRCAATNFRSHRLLIQVGAVFEGVTRHGCMIDGMLIDQLRFGVTRFEWPPTSVVK